MGRAWVGQSWVARAVAALVAVVGLLWLGTVPAASAATAALPGVRAVVAPQGDQPLPETGDTDAVSCPAVGACVGIGVATDESPGAPRVPVAYRQTGGSWAVTVLPRPAGLTGIGFAAISCPTTTWCLAFGQGESSGESYGFTETESAGKWTVAVPPGLGNLDLRQLSCWAPGGCLSTNGVSMLQLEGSVWSPEPIPGGMAIRGLSCPFVDSCVAVGDSGTIEATQAAILRQSSTGWQLSTVPVPQAGHQQELLAVSCATADSCTAVGYDEYQSRFLPLAATITPAGANETTPPGLPPELTGVSCATAGWCYATGGEVLSGGGWTMTPEVGPAGASCPAAGECVAPGGPVGGFGLYADGQWTGQAVPMSEAPAATALSGVSCWRAGQCVADGSTYTDDQTTAMAISRDSGAWPASIVDLNHPGALTSVSCVTGGHCLAIDGGLFASSADGRHWSTFAGPGGPQLPGVALEAVSCWASMRCVAVGSSTTGAGRPIIVEFVGGGYVTNVLSLPATDGRATLTGVSCTSATRCAAVGSVTVGTSTRPLVAWLSGGKWQHESLGSGVLDAVSCPPTGSCVAVGTRVGHDMVAGQQGRGWKATVSPVPTHAPPTTLSCPARGQCWSTANTGPGSLALVSVSPTNARAVLPINVAGEYTASLSGISCPTASSCTVVGTAYGPRGSVGLVGLFDPA